MFAFLRILLCAHLLHFNRGQTLHKLNQDVLHAITTTEMPLSVTAAATAELHLHSNLSQLAAQVALVDDREDTELVEATAVPVFTPRSSRFGRQLYFNPNMFLPQSLGWKGTRCLDSRGATGVCLRISSCRQYHRITRQIKFVAVLRQWTQPVSKYINDVCSFYDSLGRVNNGICCTDIEHIEFGVFPIGPPPLAETPVLPLPAPPVAQMPEKFNTTGNETDNVDIDANSSDFQDINHVDVENNQKKRPTMSPVPVTYDDVNFYQYQWPTSLGQFASLPQWPPPIPTHPPTTGGWPPPIPTHPPNHHYPTHPTSSATHPKPPSSTTATKRTTTTPKTTRRPSYPGYPGYPSYPTYPTYRPTSKPVTTISTTRRPVSSDAGSAQGLPLKCGIKNPVSPDQERIVGGTNASPYEFPWIAVLFKSGKQFCGGSLITKNHILTAAHCVARMTSWDVAALTAHLGDYNIRTDFEVKHIERRIKRLVRHKGFDFSKLHNDIAILTLNEPVQFTHEIQPICLPISAAQQSRSYSGHIATVAGWGSLRENGPQPSILQKVDIPIWNNLECARKYGRAAPGGIIESMICAGQAAKDSCSGDSGGPMIVNEGGRYTQVGIVSWGIGCGKGQYPGVYTRVTSLLPWIYKNIK